MLLIFTVVVWRRGQASAHKSTRFAFNTVFAAVFLQMVLGVVTVMTFAHMHVAITHQIMAVVVVVLILRARFLSHYPIATSVRDAA